MKNILLTLPAFFIAVSDSLFAQCLPQAANDCTEWVPLVCTLEGYCGATAGPEQPTTTLTCNTVNAPIYGAQIIRFVATEAPVNLLVHFENCNGVMEPFGNTVYGMAAYLFGSCPGTGTEALTCNSSSSQSGQLRIIYQDAVPGEELYLVLTGLSGNICSYEIEVISGVDPLPELGTPQGEWEGSTGVCKGEIVVYIAPEVENADEYLWEIDGNVFATLMNSLEIEWHQGYAPGPHTLCVTAINRCGISEDYACLTIDVSHIQEVEYEAVLCQGDGLVIDGEFYAAPGEYHHIEEHTVGCDIHTFIYLDVFDAIEISGGVLQHDDGAGTGSIEVQVSGGVPPFAYMWSNQATGPQLSGLAAGIYTLTVTDVAGCTATFQIEVELHTSASGMSSTAPAGIYPNPVSLHQSITLSLPEGVAVSKVEYYTMSGSQLRVVYPHATGQHQVWPGFQASGMYIIRATGIDGRAYWGKVLAE